MAIEDALQVIAADWADIEPRLAVRELTALAEIGPPASRGNDEGERSLAILEIIADALPPDHRAWSALRSSGTRFDPGPQQRRAARTATAQIIDLAADALTSPMIPADAAADDLEDRNVAAIVASGGRYGPAHTDDEHLLSIQVAGQPFFPQFQFRPQDPDHQYELVARLREQLGADSDPAGAAAWWLTPNPWLQARPADLLGTSREAQIGYAADQLANDCW